MSMFIWTAFHIFRRIMTYGSWWLKLVSLSFFLRGRAKKNWYKLYLLLRYVYVSSLIWLVAPGNREVFWYLPLNYFAGWCGEIRDVIFSDNGSVTVVYRVTVRGSDGEVSLYSWLSNFYFEYSLWGYITIHTIQHRFQLPRPITLFRLNLNPY